MGRVDSIERELDGFVARLRDGVNDVAGQLKTLADDVGELRTPGGDGDSESEPRRRRSETAESGSGATNGTEPSTADEPDAAPATGQEPPQTASPPQSEKHTESGQAEGKQADGGRTDGGETDLASAKMIALDMALAHKPREEARRVLAGQYDLDDLAALVDEVYASVDS